VFQDKASLPKINPDTRFAVLSQTTLNFAYVQEILEEIKKEYPNAFFPMLSDVCKATYERQTVVIQNLDKFEAFLVI